MEPKTYTVRELLDLLHDACLDGLADLPVYVMTHDEMGNRYSAGVNGLGFAHDGLELEVEENELIELTDVDDFDVESIFEPGYQE